MSDDFKISARSQVLLNKVAILHDPESRALDDIRAVVRQLRTHFEGLEQIKAAAEKLVKKLDELDELDMIRVDDEEPEERKAFAESNAALADLKAILERTSR